MASILLRVRSHCARLTSLPSFRINSFSVNGGNDDNSNVFQPNDDQNKSQYQNNSYQNNRYQNNQYSNNQYKKNYSQNKQNSYQQNANNFQKLEFNAWIDSLSVTSATHQIVMIPIPVHLLEKPNSLSRSPRFFGIILQLNSLENGIASTNKSDTKYFRIPFDQLHKIMYYNSSSDIETSIYDNTKVQIKYLSIKGSSKSDIVELSVNAEQRPQNEFEQENDSTGSRNSSPYSPQDFSIRAEIPKSQFAFIQDNLKTGLPYLNGWAYSTNYYQQKNGLQNQQNQ